MAVTIKDVAALVGVSPSTVSRTYRNNPSISEETKERVRRAARQLGYQTGAAQGECIGLRTMASFCRRPRARSMKIPFIWK